MIDFVNIEKHQLERMVKGLVSASPQAGRWRVETPLLYPSGRSVAIEIVNSADTVEISDVGLGFNEAYATDVHASFIRAAKTLSADYGVAYERRQLFIPRVRREQIPAALKLVANCSQAAVLLATERAGERKAAERGERLYHKLRRLFPNTAKQAQIKGASNTEWTVDALVQIGDNVTVFDAVTNHSNSVSSTATKFRDLALKENSPRRGAAVESKNSMGTLLAVLAQAANVIEDDAPDAQFQQLAQAA